MTALRFCSWGFCVWFCLSSASGAERVRVRQAGGERELRGQVLVEAQDGGLFFLDEQQSLWTIDPDELLERTQDEEPFVPLDQEAMATLLSQEFPGFQIHRTTHYLVCYNTSPAYAKWCGALFERLYKAFSNYWRNRGLEIHDPEWPLVALVFKSRSDYAEYARQELASTRSITGYYSLRTNRVATYDLTETGGRLPRARNSQAIKRLILQQPQGERTVATIIHEATHQLAFNCGLHQRFADIPLWVSEGLAIYFETPDLSSSRGWKTIGAVNGVRNAEFRRYLPGRPFDSLRTLTSADERFRKEATAAQAYAEAWALTYFLIRKRPKEYQAFLQQLAAKKPLLYDTPDERWDAVLQVFGDPAKLDEEFRKYMLLRVRGN